MKSSSPLYKRLLHDDVIINLSRQIHDINTTPYYSYSWQCGIKIKKILTLTCRWPVAYFGSYPATAHQLYTTFWKCVDLLDEHGFTVDYVMADGASTNRTFTNMLFQGSPRESNFIFPDVFFKGHHMCAIQDIMHVLKKIRNNIESSRGINKTGSGRYMVLNDKCIVWDHWINLQKRLCFTLQTNWWAYQFNSCIHNA